MVLVFLLLLHPYFHCCPNLSSYLRLRKHQMQMRDADTRLSQISVIAKVLHQLHFHPHLQCPSFKPCGPSMPKGTRMVPTRQSLGEHKPAVTTQQHNQPCGCSSSTYRVLILQEFPTIPLLVKKERSFSAFYAAKA